jgi:hypothetical protein
MGVMIDGVRIASLQISKDSWLVTYNRKTKEFKSKF